MLTFIFSRPATTMLTCQPVPYAFDASGYGVNPACQYEMYVDSTGCVYPEMVRWAQCAHSLEGTFPCVFHTPRFRFHFRFRHHRLHPRGLLAPSPATWPSLLLEPSRDHDLWTRLRECCRLRSRRSVPPCGRQSCAECLRRERAVALRRRAPSHMVLTTCAMCPWRSELSWAWSRARRLSRRSSVGRGCSVARVVTALGARSSTTTVCVRGVGGSP